MIDSTDFTTGGNENAASIIKNPGGKDMTCRTAERTSPEMPYCVTARPHFLVALRAETKTLGGL